MLMYQTIDDLVVGVIGLGYVGLPLAVEFSKQRVVRAFDIDRLRVQELRSGFDRTMEVTSSELKAASDLEFFTRNIIKITLNFCHFIRGFHN